MPNDTTLSIFKIMNDLITCNVLIILSKFLDEVVVFNFKDNIISKNIQ